MLRTAIVGIVVVLFAASGSAPAAPKKGRASCEDVRKREEDLVKRLAVAKSRIAELEAQIAAEMRRLQEEKREMSKKLK